MSTGLYYADVIRSRARIEAMVKEIDAMREVLVQPLHAAHRADLVEAFIELEAARAALVNAHSEISGTVPGHVTQEAP